MEKYKLEKGIFGFLDGQGFSIHDMRDLLTRYALTKNILRPKNKRTKWYVFISELAQDNFIEFLKFYKENNKHTKNCKKSKLHSYNEWYDECNSDGSFAYNEIAKDF